MSRKFGQGLENHNIVIDRLMIQFRSWDENRINEIVHELGGDVYIRVPPVRLVGVQIDHTKASDLFLAYQNHPEVESVDFDSYMQPQALYNQAYDVGLLNYEWNLHRMSVLPAWKHATGAGILVAVVDTGMDVHARSKPEFASKTQHHWNSVTNSPYYIDLAEEQQDATLDPASTKHGLHTIGLATAGGKNDGAGTLGVAPDADIVNMAAWDPSYIPQGRVFTSGAQAGIVYAYDTFGAKVISLSFGGTGSKPVSSSWNTMMSYLKDKALVFVASGNDALGSESDNMWGSPAYEATVYNHFAVGGMDFADTDRPAIYSNFGSYVNIVTPCNQVWTPHWAGSTGSAFLSPPGWTSIFPGSMTKSTVNYIQFQGTSAAAPLAAGAAAVIWSVNPAWPPSTVRTILLACQDKPAHWLWQQRFPNAGVINVLKGVLMAKSILNTGQVYPYVGFMGPGVKTTVTAGVATTHLRGPLTVEVTAYSTNTVTNVQLWAGTKLVYSGVPRTIAGGNPLYVNADYLTDGNIKVVATAGNTVEETYTDITAYAMPAGTVAPPLTSASPMPIEGQRVPGDLITLSAASDAHPVRISYRLNGGAWQRYSAPFGLPAGQTVTLEFYGVDCLGNVEGGVDYDPDP